MKFFSEDLIILKHLYLNKQVKVYNLHLKYMLSPGQIARSVEKFKLMEIMDDYEESIAITPYGENWINANRRFIFLEKFDFVKKDTNYIDRIEENELYKPKMTKLDTRIFKKESDKN